MNQLDKDMSSAARNLEKLGEEVADAEQAFLRCKRAAAELAAFSDAGVEELNHVASELSRWRSSARATAAVEREADGLLKALLASDIPDIDDDLSRVLEAAGIVENKVEFSARWNRARQSLRSAKDELGKANSVVKSIADALETHESALRIRVNQDLAARGLDGARINQLQELTDQASLLDSHQAHLGKQSDALHQAEDEFQTLLQGRRDLIVQQRRVFDRVMEAVRSQFGGRIEVRRHDDGRKDTLDRFLKKLNQRGISTMVERLDG